MTADKPHVWALVGATASGKSEAALSLAERFNGEIISCDSVQVYKFFDIGSAKLSLNQRRGIPHHLIDILNPEQICTTGYWRDCALSSVQDVWERGRLPIITGGTGLYLKALFCGLFEGESTNPSVRNSLELKACTLDGLHNLYTNLQISDPIYASKIAANDKKRIIRALEALEVTGIPFSKLHEQNFKPSWEWTFVMPELPRETLYSLIEKRTLAMLEDGLIEETRFLMQHFPSSPGLSAIGYRHAVLAIEGVFDEESLVEKLTKDTRHFAKRQISLFKNLLKGQRIYSPKEIMQQRGIS